MLISLTVENFKSLKKQTTLDMRKTNITDLNDTPFKCGDNELLSVATIYGPNASGKSNFIKAIIYLASWAMNQEKGKTKVE